MVTAAAVWTLFRPKTFNAALLILTLSMSGFGQQRASAGQRAKASGRHAGTIEYKNPKYGFSFRLPKSWKGYRVLWSEWEGSVLREDGNVAREFRGPKLRIRHPKWTEEHHREDLPLMIFTIAQWNEHPSVSAAPFDPTELGRNGKYVFAVPPRWDYDFSEGWEEGQKILTTEALHTFPPLR